MIKSKDIPALEIRDDVRDILMRKDVYVFCAGSYVMSLFYSYQFRINYGYDDIDIYGKNEEAVEKLKEYMSDKYLYIGESDWSYRFLNGDTMINVIKTPSNIDGIFKYFDILQSKFVLVYDKDKFTIIYDDRIYKEPWKLKIDTVSCPVSTLDRIYRYVKKGFVLPEIEEIRKVIKKLSLCNKCC